MSATHLSERKGSIDIVASSPTVRSSSVAHVSESRRPSVISDMLPISSGAIAGTESEKRMSIRQGLRLYPKAIGWSVLLSSAIIMEGYDKVLLATFFGYPTFQQKYGELQPDGSYQIPARWQTATTVAANLGEIIGLLITGKIVDRFGYRKTVMSGMLLMICFIFVNFFAQNLTTLLFGELLCGIPWGVFQLITTSYATEVMPTALRCYTTSLINAFWLVGQLTASGVLRGLIERPDEWGYRIPFALQWMWPPGIIIGCLFAPESPWWLVRKGRLDEARAVLQRLTTVSAATEQGTVSSSSSQSDPHHKKSTSFIANSTPVSGTHTIFSVEDTLAMMVHTNELEMKIEAGTRYRDCFRGSDLRRTEITCGVYAVQNLCGSVLMGYSTYFFISAGLSTLYSFDLSVGVYGLGLVATLVSWFSMAKLGRRTLFLAGMTIQTTLLLIIGVLGIVVGVKSANGAAGKSTSDLSWAIGALLIVFTFIYNASVGPVCYSLIGEISSTRLRSKTIVLGRAFYVFWSIINNIWTPYMLNPSAWNWGARTALFWFGLSVVGILWTYWRLPEPKGRTYAELDILFDKGVSARRFGEVDVEHVLHRQAGAATFDTGVGVETNAEAGQFRREQKVRDMIKTEEKIVEDGGSG